MISCSFDHADVNSVKVNVTTTSPLNVCPQNNEINSDYITVPFHGWQVWCHVCCRWQCAIWYKCLHSLTSERLWLYPASLTIERYIIIVVCLLSGGRKYIYVGAVRRVAQTERVKSDVNLQLSRSVLFYLNSREKWTTSLSSRSKLPSWSRQRKTMKCVYFIRFTSFIFLLINFRCVLK